MSIQILAPALSDSPAQDPPKVIVLVSDLSGSMGWATGELARRVNEKIDEIRPGDALIVAYFSGRRDFGVVAEGVLENESERQRVKQAVLKFFQPRGMTMFSEILASLPKTIQKYAHVSNHVNFVFMSDGQATDAPRAQELFESLKACVELSKWVVGGSCVAFGDYADSDFLAKLAIALRVEFIRAQRTEEVTEAFSKASKGKAVKRRRVVIPKTASMVFAVDKGAQVVVVLNGGEADVEVAETADVYSFEKQASANGKSLVPEAGIYAAAYCLLQGGKVDDAVEILSSLGDVALVDAIYNAITPAEFAKGEALLKTATFSEAGRFTRGRKVGCKPAEDAFDLVDLLTLLSKDPDALIHLNHPAFEYKRIGRKEKVKDGYPAFKALEMKVPFGGLVTHKTRLNIGVSTFANGKVELADAAAALGFTNPFIAKKFTARNLIANGKPNVTKLPVSISEATYKVLAEKGLLGDDLLCGGWEAGRVFVLDLTSIPACCRARGKNSFDLEALAYLALESLWVGSELKVYKAKWEELDPGKKAKESVEYTGEQISALDSCGIKPDGTYSPPTVKEDATDVFDWTVFEAKVVGGSPVKVDDMLLMEQGKKKENLVGGFMLGAHRRISAYMPKQKGSAIAWLMETVESLKKEQRELETQLALSRYAIAVSGAWTRNMGSAEEKAVVAKVTRGSVEKQAEVKFVFGTEQEKI